VNAYQIGVPAVAALLVAILVAMHAPGQISVDSGTALYEGLVGKAIGWGPTFFAAVLEWLGGGVVGASMFVGLNTLVTYALFSALLLVGVETGRLPWWRLLAAMLLAANPIFMLYVGILWKDVLLATVAAAAVVLLLLLPRRKGPGFLLSGSLAMVCVAALPLIRQQGILLAVPLALAGAYCLARRIPTAGWRRPAAMAGMLVLTGMASQLLALASARQVEPLPASPVSVGVSTIQAYDVIGMVAYALPGDDAAWTKADAEAIRRMQVGYSAERIDTLWHDTVVRHYIDSLRGGQLRRIWLAGIGHDPVAYLTHRRAAFAALLGFGDMAGCVPAYWGVAAAPEQLEAVGLQEEMDPRDRQLGAIVLQLQSSLIFRHWWYAGILLVATVVVLRPRAGIQINVLRAVVLAAWAYLLSFLPATIACDFRYLYPVVMLVTVVGIYLLLHPRPESVADVGADLERAA
jgi:hypothetical protein